MKEALDLNFIDLSRWKIGNATILMTQQFLG
jgi:hypothetical protein